MISFGEGCFLSIPNPRNERILIPGTAGRTDARSCRIEFAEPIELEPGDEVTLFAEWRHRFHQQPAKVLSVEPARFGRPLSIHFERIGDPIGSTSRSCYRVSVISQNLSVRIDNQFNCPIADVSADGLSVITRSPLMIGRSVDVNFEDDAGRAHGPLRVQAERPLPGGKFRYGLHADDPNSPMGKALQSLSTLMQRRQLQRLSRLIAA